MFIICDSSKHMQNTCIVDAKRLFPTNTYICNICGYKNIQGRIPAKHMQVAQVITLQLSPSHSSTGIDSSFACNIANCKSITFQWQIRHISLFLTRIWNVFHLFSHFPPEYRAPPSQKANHCLFFPDHCQSPKGPSCRLRFHLEVEK